MFATKQKKLQNLQNLQSPYTDIAANCTSCTYCRFLGYGGSKHLVTPPANPKTLTDVNASRVPELGCGWKNLSNRWRPVTQVLLGFYLGHVCVVQAFFNCVELRQNTAKNTKNYRNEQAGPENIGVNEWKVHRIYFPIIHRIEAECAYEKDRSTKNIHQHHNHSDDHTKSGPSDNPCCTGYSVPEVLLPTEFLKHLGCKVSYFSSSQIKIAVIFTVR